MAADAWVLLELLMMSHGCWVNWGKDGGGGGEKRWRREEVESTGSGVRKPDTQERMESQAAAADLPRHGLYAWELVDERQIFEVEQAELYAYVHETTQHAGEKEKDREGQRRDSQWERQRPRP
jgi:hypothetical protein